MTVTAYVTREWQREPDPSALALLRAHAPQYDALSWLTLQWHPGYAARGRPQDEAETIERWVLYQVIPPQFTYPLFIRDRRALLNGNSRPRFELNMELLDTVQRQLYMETGCYAQPILCVQGPNGGTPWRFTRAEQLCAAARELPTDPAPPGELAYCDLTRQALDALSQRDRFLRWEMLGELANRQGVQLDAEEANDIRRAREEFWNWSEERMRRDIDAYSSSSGLKAAAADLPLPHMTREDRLALARSGQLATRESVDREREAFITSI